MTKSQEMYLFAGCICMGYLFYLYFTKIYFSQGLTDEEYEMKYGEGTASTRPTLALIFGRWKDLLISSAFVASIFVWMSSSESATSAAPIAFTNVPPF